MYEDYRGPGYGGHITLVYCRMCYAMVEALLLNDFIRHIQTTHEVQVFSVMMGVQGAPGEVNKPTILVTSVGRWEI